MSGIKKLFCEFLDSKKKAKREMAERAASRQDMSLNEKVQMVSEQIKSVNNSGRSKWAIANIEVGKSDKLGTD